ncbi:MAG: Gfo/Idh/MocA family oxidoreductase [Candidatus Omnitrophica bacterium]|nr:Gfo/Idh/MocA family oxidoreductase [Candidatus Omnitrophota bacterium]
MVKIGIIGTGGMGRYHANILKKMNDVKIVSACDVNIDSLNSFKNEFGIEEIYTDFKELLKKSDVDAIICATPTHLHYEIVVKAAKSKKHIFCEKPIAINLRQAEKMIEECEKNNVIFQIGYVRRFDEEWLKFKELMDKKIIGRPVIWQQIWGGSGPSSDWFYDIKKGMGPFVDGAVHSYDFAIYTFGKVKKVKSSLLKFKKFTSPDTGVVSVEFEGGDILVLCWSWGLPKNVSSQYLHQALGPEGVLIFAGYQDEKEKYFVVRKEKGEEKIGPIPLNSLVIGFEKQMSHFIECIKDNKKPIVSGIDGYESLKVALQVIKNWFTRSDLV